MSLGMEPIDRFAIFSYFSDILSMKDGGCSLESDTAGLILNFVIMLRLLFPNCYFTNIIVFFETFSISLM